ncbi:MBL fold metallo-hydrolase [Pectobacterium carotovorum]|uniref:MBL fold metallo-hydrolase n=1 Tax=Pectobacterium carotovorum TaxID=554 RepID=A0A419AYS9_PECCA|nr:MBL fold metallo-hydrolase [Pectobacterium carotovorum]RJL52980.1 MBL fold metallo-hydrolase [Pectobacterium carotovorum]
MPITVSVLLENRLNSGSINSLRAKAGLSLFIQDENDSILFDTGPDDSFLHNAALMGIDLTSLTVTVLSHGHYDHCGGVSWLPDKCRIVCHPLVASERYSAVRFSNYTARIKKLSPNIDYSHHRMEYSSAPLHIGKRFMWSGEIPVTKPEAYGVIGGENAGVDFVKDEGVLIYKSDRGLIIFIGCGHRGLIDIVRHCQKITGVNHIHALFGGFHLRCASPRKLWGVRQFLCHLKPDKIMGCHCTGKWGGLWLPNATTPKTGDTYVLG